jgi:hypothetical protein
MQCEELHVKIICCIIQITLLDISYLSRLHSHYRYMWLTEYSCTPNQWVPGALSLGIKRPGREADHSPPSSSEVKNVWSYTSTPPIRLHGVVLSWAQGQLYLFLCLIFIFTCTFILLTVGKERPKCKEELNIINEMIVSEVHWLRTYLHLAPVSRLRK